MRSDVATIQHPGAVAEQQRCGIVRSKPQHGEGPVGGKSMAANTDERTRLAAEMDRRRIKLGLRWEHIADKARISTTHLRKIRRGDTGASEIVIASLEDALQWERGSIAQILAGGRPAEQAGSEAPALNATLGELLLARGLARPEELNISDNVVGDPIVLDVLGMGEISEESRDRLLAAYARMRREIFEMVRREMKRPRG